MSLTNATPLQAAQAARAASRKLAILPTEARNESLRAIHAGLKASQDEILEANVRDLTVAKQAAADGVLSKSLLSRLDLGKPGKFEDMLQGILDVAGLPDPVGKLQSKTLLDDGLVLERRACPIGVLLIIFEARPEVIANIASLAIKSGNAAILKGGKESTETFKAISTVISRSLDSTSVPNHCLQLVTTRDAIEPLLQLDKYIDLVIPRGGNELVRKIKSSTQIPVLGHADGICAAYLRADIPVEKAASIIVDSKTTYPAACNSLETLLVDQDALQGSLVPVARALLSRGVTLKCDELSKAALSTGLEKDQAALVQSSTPEDYYTEFLDLVLAVQTIPTAGSPDDALALAVEHINEHGSHHTDLILTGDASLADKFMTAVDSASVYWNVSTRMADGQRYGFGTEVGISTNKIHSRGPVGLDGLCIYKWRLVGDGHVTADYGAGKKSWKHQQLPLSNGI